MSYPRNISRELAEQLMLEKRASRLTYKEMEERHGVPASTLCEAARIYGLRTSDKIVGMKPYPCITGNKSHGPVSMADKVQMPRQWQSKTVYVRIIGPGLDEAYAPTAGSEEEAIGKVRRQIEHRARFLPMEAGRYRITAGDDAKTVVVVEIGEVAA